MIRPMIICSLATLLVCASAIPKFRENNELDPTLEKIEDGKYVKGNLDTNLDHVDDAFNKIYSRNEFDPNRDVKAAGWWDNNGVHNLTVGYRTYQDRLLLQQFVYKPYKSFHISNQTVRFGSTRASPYIVTQVEAYDRHTNPHNAGYARIVAGGVGRANVTIQVESERGQSLDYLVRVWGHRRY